jgi:hypothetical protein
VAVVVGYQYYAYRSDIEVARFDGPNNELTASVEAILWSAEHGEPGPLAWDESLASLPISGAASLESSASDLAEPADLLAQREAELLEEAPSWLVAGVTGEAAVDETVDAETEHAEPGSDPNRADHSSPAEAPSDATRE